MNLDQTVKLPPCVRCGHPNAWHRHDDYADAGENGHGSHGTNLDEDPYTGCPFRCLGFDVWSDGPPPPDACDCPDYVLVPS